MVLGSQSTELQPSTIFIPREFLWALGDSRNILEHIDDIGSEHSSQLVLILEWQCWKLKGLRFALPF